jgi:putative component of membrane protein insertase Oxa1/YidC/SpoIIIJ protein YidD
MRLAAIRLVQIYRKFAPSGLRDRCIFSESCSAYVERKITEGGIVAGLAALLERLRQCRPGYAICTVPETGEAFLLLRDRSMLRIDKAAAWIRQGLDDRRQASKQHNKPI